MAAGTPVEARAKRAARARSAVADAERGMPGADAAGDTAAVDDAEPTSTGLESPADPAAGVLDTALAG